MTRGQVGRRRGLLATLVRWTTTPNSTLSSSESEAAGLVEQYVNEDGQPAMRFTPECVRVARQLAMVDVDGQDALMAALLVEGD